MPDELSGGKIDPPPASTEPDPDFLDEVPGVPLTLWLAFGISLYVFLLVMGLTTH